MTSFVSCLWGYGEVHFQTPFYKCLWWLQWAGQLLSVSNVILMGDAFLLSRGTNGEPFWGRLSHTLTTWLEEERPETIWSCWRSSFYGSNNACSWTVIARGFLYAIIIHLVPSSLLWSRAYVSTTPPSRSHNDVFRMSDICLLPHWLLFCDGWVGGWESVL